MASAIDPTKPITGTPTTGSVRDNFAAAKAEIEALQAANTSAFAAIDALDTGKVNRNGDTLTGDLTLFADPTNPLHAAAKQYVDAKMADAPGAVFSFNTRLGAITLTSPDVTAALAFTPYNATNPSGYQTAAQVTAALPVASSTLPIVAGVAAIGVGTTFARADHVHPSGGGGVTTFNTRSGAVTLTNADVIGVLPSSASNPVINGTAAPGSSTAWSRSDHVHPTDATRAPLASPTFTGTVTLPATMTATVAHTFFTANQSGGATGPAITIKTGTTVNGNSGDLTLDTGIPSGSGTRGIIRIPGPTIFGTSSTVGGCGFWGAAGYSGTSKPTVSGSRGGNAALAALITMLSNYGLCLDGTSA